MKRYIKQLKPNRFDDIIAMVALYRPGPMQWIDDFVARKHGSKQVEYFHPKMKDALETTYGVIVYQEQVMQISKDLCGFSGAQADTLRKAIGKKIPEMLAKQKDSFIEGAIKTSKVDRAQVETLWTSLEDFAAYAFPKAHAACYALIAYQTAYLKAHYPAAFMAALMTSDHENTDRIAIEINECKHMGIEVLPPDVNESFVEFAVRPKDEAIRFGLAAIKNVGIGAVEGILLAREDGKFVSVEDFAKRVGTQVANKKTWESLIKAGAFDSLADRSTLLYNLDMVVAFANRLQKEGLAGQTDLFGGSAGEAMLPKLSLDAPPEGLGERERLSFERALLGVYLTKHPLEEFSDYLGKVATPLAKVTTGLEGQVVAVGGYITELRRITTKNGSAMAFVKLEDLSGELELIVFPKSYETAKSVWEADQIVYVRGKVNSKDRDGHTAEPKIMVDEAELIDEDSMQQRLSQAESEVKPKQAKPVPPEAKPSAVASADQLIITIPTEKELQKLAQLKEMLSRHQGSSEVVILVGKDAETKIRLPFTVDLSNGLRAELESLFSVQAVAIS
jgi:DNA polymerase-3 subunit alpha